MTCTLTCDWGCQSAKELAHVYLKFDAATASEKLAKIRREAIVRGHCAK